MLWLSSSSSSQAPLGVSVLLSAWCPAVEKANGEFSVQVCIGLERKFKIAVSVQLWFKEEMVLRPDFGSGLV